MQMDTAILPPILQITPESMSVDWTLPGGQSKPLADLADTVVDLWLGIPFLAGQTTHPIAVINIILGQQTCPATSRFTVLST